MLLTSSEVSTTSVNRLKHRDYPTLLEMCVGSFKSPDRSSRDQLNGLTSLSTDGVTKEGRIQKVQPSTRPRIEAGTSWLAVRDLTNFVEICGN